MYHKQKNLLYAELPDLDAIIVGLAYKNEDYCLHIILPNEMFGISKLEARLTNIDLSTLTALMDFKLISLYMPKFTTKFKVSMTDALRKVRIFVFKILIASNTHKI